MAQKRCEPPAIGISGGVGAGKSLALSILRRSGFAVLSADRVGHRLLKRRDIQRRVRKAFGDAVLGPRGIVDRRRLAQAVFRDAQGVARINRILHPAIRSEIRTWLKAFRRRPDGLWAAVEVPLLFETRLQGQFHGVLSITAPIGLRCRRVGRDAVRLRERYQWKLGTKDRLSDWVIRNDSTPATFARRLRAWIKRLKDHRCI